jgi:hypothetical protein
MMNIRDRYKKAFNHYYDYGLNDEKVLQMIEKKCSGREKHFRYRWAVIALASVLLVLSTTYVFASAGWLHIADIFRSSSNDQVSADLADAGIIQALDIAGENDDFTLKLVAFTGDIETHKVLFELTPKKDLGDYEMRLVGQTVSPEVMEENKNWISDYAANEAPGSRSVSDSGSDVYYFNFELPPHWVKETNEDVVIRISGIKLYDGESLAGIIGCELMYRFTPDRSILQKPVIIAVNELITKKDVYNDYGITYEYDPKDFYKGEITAPSKDMTLMIDNIALSNYEAVINTRIMDKDITNRQASLTHHQCIEPVFVTSHFWNGLDGPRSYSLVLIDNTERFRLFADGVEIPYDDDDRSLNIQPGKGSDGYYDCPFIFKGFDYQNAESIEIHFGEQVIKVK